MYGVRGIRTTLNAYARLITAVKARDRVRTFGASDIFSGGAASTLQSVPIEHHYFSDTILLWTPLSAESLSPFLTACADLFVEALSMGIPLRGAISVGEAVLDKKKGVFIGQPIIDAARLEHEQNWLGLALAKPFRDLWEHINSDLVLPTTPPAKEVSSPLMERILHSGFAVDWPRRMRGAGDDPIPHLGGMNTSASHHEYYANTASFISRSRELRNWNRKLFIPISFAALRRSLLAVQSGDVKALPGWVESMIDMSATELGATEAGAEALREFACNTLLPEKIRLLPDEPRRYLEHLIQIRDGEAADLEAIALAAVEARLLITGLPPRHKKVLDLADAGPLTASLNYLKLLANGEELPKLPEHITPQEARVLVGAKDAVEGKTVPIDIETLFAAVIYAAFHSMQLDAENQHRLAFLSKGKQAEKETAQIFSSFLGGTLPAHAAGITTPQALEIQRIIEATVALQKRSSHFVSGILDELREEPSHDCLVDLALNCADRDAKDKLGKSAEVIARIAKMGSPHDAVARFLSNLKSTTSGAGIPSGLPASVNYYLDLVRHLFLGSSIKVDISDLVQLSFKARETRLDCYLVAALRVISLNSPENSKIAITLKSIARRDEKIEVPEFDNPELSEWTAQLLHALDQFDHNVDPETFCMSLVEAYARGNLAIEDADKILRGITGQPNSGEFVAAWLIRLFRGETLPEPPSEFPKKLCDLLFRAQLSFIEIRSDVTLLEALRAGVARRSRGVELPVEVRQFIKELRRVGGMHSEVGDYLTSFAKSGSWPRLPLGLPPLVLSKLASARRSAAHAASVKLLFTRGKARTPRPSLQS